MAQETSRKFSNVFWDNDQKTRVNTRLVVGYDDGTTQVFNAVVSKTEDGNPDWDNIMKNIGPEKIEEATTTRMRERIKRREEERANIEERRKKQLAFDKQEALFACKLEAFEIEEIKNSKNRDLKARIRKSKTVMEVHAYTTILLEYEYNLAKEQTKSEQPAEQPKE